VSFVKYSTIKFLLFMVLFGVLRVYVLNDDQNLLDPNITSLTDSHRTMYYRMIPSLLGGS